METLSPFKGAYRDITPIMENQMEKNMENEIQIGEYIRNIGLYTPNIRHSSFHVLFHYPIVAIIIAT